MSAEIDSLLERAREPGHFVERKRFTLARDKALEKLQRFSLRNREQFLLELLQAGVLLGADFLAVDVFQGALTVAWVGGRALPRPLLEDYTDYLLVDRGRRELLAEVEFAVGLHALLGRKPRLLRVETREPGGEPLLLELRGQRASLGRPADEGPSGTYLHAELPHLSLPWNDSLVYDDASPLVGMVEERFRYSPVPLLLNGRLPFGEGERRLGVLFGVEDVLRVQGEGREAVLGIPQEGTRTGFDLVFAGARVTRVELPELGSLPDGRNLVGVIRDTGLRKTADFSDFVRDERWAAMLAWLQPHATRLLRRHVPGYAPPPLPEPVREEAGSGPVELLPRDPPDPVPALHGPPLPLEELASIPQGEPVFWTEPGRAEELRSRLGPLELPRLCLLLQPAEALGLAQRLPTLSLAPLRSATDADFLLRMLGQGSRVHSRELSVPHSSLGSWRVELRLHERGWLPRWGRGEGVPVAVAASPGGVEQTFTLRLPLPLPRCSAVFRWDEERAQRPPPASTELAPETLAPLLDTTSWGYLELLAELPPGALPRLAPPLLAALSWPLYRLESGRLVVDALLPRELEDERAVLDLPLARLESGEPLRFRDYLAALGGSPLRLAPNADPGLLEPLERRYGYGYLQHPELERPLLRLARRGERWQLLPPEAELPEGTEELLWLAGCLHPAPPPGWRRAPAPPSLGRALPGDAPSAGPPTEGMRLLLAAIEGLLRAPKRELGERQHALLRRARVELTALLKPEKLDELLAELGARPGSASGPLPFAPPGGPRLDEPGLLLLDPGLVSALLGAGVRLRPRYDDAAGLWRSLSRPDAGDWLLRRELYTVSLSGWLGLRFPFDPTTGVFLENGRDLHALESIEQHFPCHGLLRSAGPGLERAEAEDAASAAAAELYDALADQLDELERSGPPERLEAARAYAARAVALAWSRGREQGGIFLELDRHLPVPGADGRRWGSWLDWLRAEPAERPPRPRAYPPPPPREVEEAPRNLPLLLHARLEEACPGMRYVRPPALAPLGGRPVQALRSEKREASGAGPLRLVLSTESELVRRLLADPRPAESPLLDLLALLALDPLGDVLAELEAVPGLLPRSRAQRLRALLERMAG